MTADQVLNTAIEKIWKEVNIVDNEDYNQGLKKSIQVVEKLKTTNTQNRQQGVPQGTNQLDMVASDTCQGLENQLESVLKSVSAMPSALASEGFQTFAAKESKKLKEEMRSRFLLIKKFDNIELGIKGINITVPIFTEDGRIGNCIDIACGWIRDNADGGFNEDSFVRDWIIGSNGRVGTKYNYSGGEISIVKVG